MRFQSLIIGSAFAFITSAALFVGSANIAHGQTIPTSIYLPFISNSNGVTQTVNTEFTMPKLKPAINPLAIDYDMDFSIVASEGKAIDYMTNVISPIKNKETITGTGNVNVQLYTGELGDLPVEGRAYTYVYHTQSKDYGMIQYRAYDRLPDGRYMTFTLIGKYTMDSYNQQLTLHPDDQFDDSYILFSDMIEQFHPSPAVYYTKKVQ